jgi:adenylate kinase
LANSNPASSASSGALQDYHTKTQPILELFRHKELVVRVNGTCPPAEVQEDLRRQLAQKSQRELVG